MDKIVLTEVTDSEYEEMKTFDCDLELEENSGDNKNG